MPFKSLLTVCSVSLLLLKAGPSEGNNVIFKPVNRSLHFFPDNGDESREIDFGDISTNLITPAAVPGRTPTIRDIGGKRCGVPYGTLGYKGTCWRLLTQGPCKSDEWFVKSNDSKVSEGKCALRPCSKAYVPHRGKCVSPSDRGACSRGQMLFVDFTGEAYCDCAPNYFYDPWAGHCFTQEDRGSCNFGEFLQVTEGDRVLCVPNPCLAEGFAYNNGSKKCYKKSFRGACALPYSLIWHHMNMTVECLASSTHSIFELPTRKACPTGSVRDLLHNCREDYSVPAEVTYPSSYGECEHGFIKDLQGVCRKAHKLFT